MYKNLKKFKEVVVLSKKELRKVCAGTAPDCEDGFVPDGNGGCVPERTDGSRNDDTSPRCDRA